MALPPAFPYHDLIVLTAFAVVLGTLLIQGLTLKPLLRRLNLRDDDPVGRELSAARERALHAGLASFATDRSPTAEFTRQAFTARLGRELSDANAGDPRSKSREIYRSSGCRAESHSQNACG
jgi:monovalent cation/hydrogen antiporter